MSHENQSINLDAVLNETELEEFKEILQTSDNGDVIELLQCYLSKNPNNKFVHFEEPHMSIRDYFLYEINKKQPVNNNIQLITVESDGYVYDGNIFEKLWNNYLNITLTGVTYSCPNPDVLIRNYRVEHNAVVPRYNALTKTWEKGKSLVVYFETFDGNFVYVSVVNTVKTRESFNQFMELLKSL